MKIYIYTSRDTQTGADLETDTSEAATGYLEALEVVRQTIRVWYKTDRGMEKTRGFYLGPSPLATPAAHSPAHILPPASLKRSHPLVFSSSGVKGLVWSHLNPRARSHAQPNCQLRPDQGARQGVGPPSPIDMAPLAPSTLKERHRLHLRVCRA